MGHVFKFFHHSVLLKEAVSELAINKKRTEGIYVDGTFGRGGHSRLILKHLGNKGRLIAFDKDPQAVAEAKTIIDSRFDIIHDSFAHLDSVLKARGIDAVDGILLDLGISSPQLDDASRGFSFRLDGPLDMRMDPTKGMSASQWLASETEQKIMEVIKAYGEERFAVQIAKEIVASRTIKPIITTGQLAQIVSKAIKTRERNKNPATRTFQAIRIHINEELKDLEIGLKKAWDYLANEGRMAVISFHSLEDRIVKQFFTDHATVKQPDRRLPIKARDMPMAKMKLLGRKKPSKEEIEINPRARSAILRAAMRIGNPDEIAQ